jgi:ABC-type glutathione transport system ATPase component
VLKRYPIELSGGMKQRMVMVISTLLDPSLLIADEITSALDVSTQRAVAETLVSFRDHGFVKSMIVITHDMSILYQIADSILVMYAGKLAEKAATKHDHRKAAPPVHADARLVAAGGRRSVRRQEAEGHSGQPAVALEPSDGLPLPGALPARLRQVRGGAAVRGSRYATTRSPAGRSPEPMLSLNRVSKIYKTGTFGGKDLVAVRDVSFDVNPGEVVSLIGESGSGKTTVGKMILKLIDISRGSISLDGEDVSSIRGSASSRTTATSRASSRTRSARTTRSSRRTVSSP